MQSIEGVKLPASRGAARAGDIRHSQADVTAARNDLGFEPHQSMRSLFAVRTGNSLNGNGGHWTDSPISKIVSFA